MVYLKFLLSLTATVLWAQHATAAQQFGCPAKPNFPTQDVMSPPNLGVLKLQLIDYKCFGAYDREVGRVLGEAKVFIEQHANLSDKTAIVLDIDETALSNWPNLVADDFGFIANGSCTLVPGDACGFTQWVLSHKAEPIAPTLALFNAARAKHISVFFISGRSEDAEQKAATIQNLMDAGYSGWSDLLLRPPKAFTSVQEFKVAKRKEIAAKGFTIIANIGDQQSDLDGGYAERVFKVPNPFYYIP
jgi:hypothetical protein